MSSVPTFTYEEMKAAYEKYGYDLTWLQPDGHPYGARPDDWCIKEGEVLEGQLVIDVEMRLTIAQYELVQEALNLADAAETAA